jgi:bleomycin hydrolase
MKIKFLILSAFILISTLSFAQEAELTFETVYDLEYSAVKSQGRTGTCWSFSTISFLESEIYRKNKVWVDLSEIYNARIIYPLKAKNYVSRQGNTQFGEGSLSPDGIYVLRNYGIVPESAFPAKKVNGESYDNAELYAILTSYLQTIVKNPAGKLSKLWLEAYNSILDVYLGEEPKEFVYEGKKYTPASFRDQFKLNADDYIQLTSFQQYDLYTHVELDIPDNWDNNKFFNIGLEEMVDVVKYALKNGYTVAIDSDVSEKTFNAKHGMAVIPEKSWNEMSSQEREDCFTKPLKEKEISPEYRQEEFDNYSTTDDHLMHITGMVKDNKGKTYFRIKNSWGTTRHGNDGNVYYSEAFFKLKTISIMLHKDGIPKKLLKKIN